MGEFDNSWGKRILKILGILLGFGFAAVSAVYLGRIDPDQIATGVLMTIAGLAVGGVSAVFLPYNHGACLKLDDSGLSARFGWNTVLNCSYSEIDSCTDTYQSLFIVLKGREKPFCIKNLKNSNELWREITLRSEQANARIPVDAEKIRRELPAMKRRKMLFRILSLVLYACGIFVLFYLTLALRKGCSWVTVLLTAVLTAAAVGAGLFFGRKYNMLDRAVAADQRRLRRWAIMSAPLPEGELYGVYAAPDYTCRTVLCRGEDGSFTGLTQSVNGGQQLGDACSRESFSPDEMNDFFRDRIELRRF